MPLEKFIKHLQYYRNLYRVDVDEIRTNKFEDSVKKRECTVKDAMKDLPECRCLGFIYTPDGALFTEGLDIIEYYKGIKLRRPFKFPRKRNYLQDIIIRLT